MQHFNHYRVAELAPLNAKSAREGAYYDSIERAANLDRVMGQDERDLDDRHKS